MAFPPEDLLWQYRFKLDIEYIEKKQVEMDEQLKTLNAAHQKLQEQVDESDNNHSAKHSEQDARMAHSRKEAQEMAGLLHTWKADLDGILEKLSQREQRRETTIKEQEKRIEALEAALRNQTLNDYQHHMTPTTTNVIEHTISQTLRELFDRVSAVNNGKLVHERPSEPGPSPLANIKIDLEPQGTRSFEEYVRYGENTIPDLYLQNVQRLEVEHTKAFVQHLRDSDLRASLWHKMDSRGWTWEILQEEAEILTRRSRGQSRT